MDFKDALLQIKAAAIAKDRTKLRQITNGMLDDMLLILREGDTSLHPISNEAVEFLKDDFYWLMHSMMGKLLRKQNNSAQIEPIELIYGIAHNTALRRENDAY